jgi:2-methylisocitrate lyase-like PEP mutase family enzyme
MLYRLQAALDARTDPNFVIIARTDARGPEGLDAAIERAHAYREIGADMVFVEAPSSLEELQRISKEFKGTPMVANMIERSRTPLVPEKELLAMGFNVILYANAAWYLGSFAIKQGLEVLRREGTSESMLDRMTSFQERQKLVGLDKLDAAERDLVARVDARRKK